MGIEKVIQGVDKVTKFLKLSRSNLIWVITILLLTVGFFVREYYQEYTNQKIKETKIIYKNDKFIKDKLPQILNSGFTLVIDTLVNFQKRESNKIKQEIRGVEKRINKNTNRKIEAVIDFIPNLDDRDVKLIKKIIEIEDDKEEVKIIDVIEEEEDLSIDGYGYGGMSWFNDSFRFNTKPIEIDTVIEKKCGFFRKIFKKNNF